MLLFFNSVSYLLKHGSVVANKITVGIRVFMPRKLFFVKFWFCCSFRMFLSCCTFFPLSHHFIFNKTKFVIRCDLYSLHLQWHTFCRYSLDTMFHRGFRNLFFGYFRIFWFFVTDLFLTVLYMSSCFQFVSHIFLFTLLKVSDNIFMISFLDEFFSRKEAFCRHSSFLLLCPPSSL